MPADQQELAAERDRLTEAYGPWFGFNVRLGQDAYAMGRAGSGPAEQRVQRILQLTTDLAGGTVDGLRILDLGCHEGGFAIELALHGARVVAVDGREGHVEKGRFAAAAVGADTVEFVQADLREALPELGAFDVVLCLGVLYHLRGPEVLRVLRQV